MPMRYLSALLIILACLAGSGCRQPEESEKSKAQKALQESFQPAEPIPAEGALLHYDGLQLGMSTLDLTQVYNAPDGKGEGFYRGFQDYDSVQTHVIEFERADDSGPRRILTLSFYRDQLYIVVDRIEGLSAEQTDEWQAKLVELYGEPASENVPGAQWSWGSPEILQLVFTRDNSSEQSMTANVVLEHKPTGEAAYNYLRNWEERHPDFLEQRQQEAAGQSEGSRAGQ